MITSTSILSREAARTSRQWQTYAARASFSGILLGLLLALVWLVVNAPFMDIADLGWLGRGMFVLFTMIQQLLIFALAPLLAASAMAEEMDDRTLDILALTHLRPNEILVGKVLSRVFVLAMISFGALPVVAVIASLGGVSVAEVLATTAHHLATIVLLSFLGGFYALFTRNAALATFAATGTAAFVYTVPSMIYAVIVFDAWDSVHLSPLLGSNAIDGWALLPVLAQIPLVALIVRLSTTLFDLHLARAGSIKRFSGKAWAVGRWGRDVLVVAVTGIGVVPAAMVCWALQLGSAAPTVATSALHVSAQGYIWVWMVAATTVALWPVLRLSADIVEGIDRMVGRSRALADRRGTPNVWSNPVAWHEARPHKLARVALPLLFSAVLALFMFAQSFAYLIPGAVVLVAMVGTGSAVGATVWMVTRSVAADRRDGTLEVLLTTPLTSLAIVVGKLAGALAAGLPLLVLTGPLYVFGLWYVDLFFPADYSAFTLTHGVWVWVWTFPAWLALVAVALAVALRTNDLRSAFVTTVGAATMWFLGAGLAGRLWPANPWIGIPARLVAPPFAGSQSSMEYAVASAGLTAAAAAMLLAISWRLRRWLVPMLALLAVLPAGAAELEMTAFPVGDGLARSDAWLPIQVEVANPGPATTGAVSWGEDGVRYRRSVDLPEGARKSLTLLVRPGTGAGKPKVILETRDGRSLAVDIALRGTSSVAVTIGVLGDDAVGINGIAEASGAPPPGRQPRPTHDEPRQVRTGLVPLAAAPSHSAGWSAFDQVVWYRPDPTRLEPPQLAALQGWVADGGHLTLVVTDTAPAVRASSLARWLPATLGPLRDLPDLDGLLGALGQPPAGPVVVAAPAAQAAPGAWVRATAADGAPLWVIGRHGLGTVTLLLADPRVAPLSTADRPALWRDVLTLPLGEPPLLPDGLAAALHAEPPPMACAHTTTSSWQDPVEAWSQPVRDYLDDIPGVAPVPMPWLLAFSATYLLLIGPLDWWILRRLRREPLTWITYPLTITVFSAIALVGTTWSKGSQAVVRRLELVDALPGTDLWRGTTFLGVFSTRKTDVALIGGFDDSVVLPLEHMGFAKEPTVEVGEGPGRFSWKAETWTLAYARSSWVAPAPGTLDVEVLPDGSFHVHNGLGTAIGPVWISRGGARTSVRTIDAGQTAQISTDDAGPPHDLVPLAQILEESLDLGHGHLESGSLYATLFAVLPAPVEPVTLTGLTPVEMGTTVLRVPVAGVGARPAALEFAVRLVEGKMSMGPIRDKLGEFAAGCFESFSREEDRDVRLTFDVKHDTAKAPEGGDDVLRCLRQGMDGTWLASDSDLVEVEVDLRWTGRRPGSPQ